MGQYQSVFLKPLKRGQEILMKHQDTGSESEESKQERYEIKQNKKGGSDAKLSESALKEQKEVTPALGARPKLYPDLSAFRKLKIVDSDESESEGESEGFTPEEEQSLEKIAAEYEHGRYDAAKAPALLPPKPPAYPVAKQLLPCKGSPPTAPGGAVAS